MATEPTRKQGGKAVGVGDAERASDRDRMAWNPRKWSRSIRLISSTPHDIRTLQPINAQGFDIDSSLD